MEENEVNELEMGFLSYNGLNKPAFFAGIPLMLMVGLLSALLFICLPSYLLIGKVAGTVVAIILLAIYMFAKLSCDNDPNALTVIKLKVLGFLRYKFKRILSVRG